MERTLRPPLAPMEARSVDTLPTDSGWQYEPKWDGFRCLAFRAGKDVQLHSKAGQPLARYFPELVAALLEVPATAFVLDGEIAVRVGERFSFNQLLQRIHPAASRVQRLAAEHPATLVVFDALALPRSPRLLDEPLRKRRAALEAFAARHLQRCERLRLSPATADPAVARQWFKEVGPELDGVIAKRLGAPYDSGGREAMVKLKPARTVDCAVGGYRTTAEGAVASLLLGLYDDAGLLHHVGFCSALPRRDKAALAPELKKLRGGPGFTGAAPGGPSRWNRGQATEWHPLLPGKVVEVSYDHFTDGRFRHGTTFLRWRPDKDPQSCRMDQVMTSGRSARWLELQAPPP